MKRERPDIDWCKLKIILVRLQQVYGLSEEGRLNWSKETAENFLSEIKSKLCRDAAPPSNDNKYTDMPESATDIGEQKSQVGLPSFKPPYSHKIENFFD